MRRNGALMVFAVAVLVGIGALLAAAGSDHRAIAFSLGEPNAAPLAPLEPGQTACQGQIPVTAAFAGIQTYLATAKPPGAGINVTVLDALDGTRLAAGRARPRFANAAVVNVGLDATVGGTGRRVVVCFRSTGPQLIALLGSGPVDPHITLTVAGHRTTSEAALIFLRPHPPSLLSLIPTIFGRAALFRPGWVGAWTFWVLAAGLVAAFAIAGWAIAQAVGADNRSSEHTSTQ